MKPCYLPEKWSHACRRVWCDSQRGYRITDLKTRITYEGASDVTPNVHSGVHIENHFVPVGEMHLHTDVPWCKCNPSIVDLYDDEDGEFGAARHNPMTKERPLERQNAEMQMSNSDGMEP